MFLLCTLVIIFQQGKLTVFEKTLRTCLENPFFFPLTNLFYNQSTTLNNQLTFISKQLVQEVNCTHYIYRHRDFCAMLLRLQLHGKSKKLIIKAISEKLDFQILMVQQNVTFSWSLFYLLFKLPTWALSWLHQFVSFKIQSRSFHHQIFLQRFHTSLAVWESVKTSVIT